MINWEFC